MRLIGIFESEKEAYAFYSFLLKEEIQNIYEPFQDPKTGHKQYRLWVYDENDLDIALEWLKRFQENPHDPQFQNIEIPLSSTPPPPKYADISEKEDLKWSSVPPPEPRLRLSFTLTHLFIILCAFLFLWSDFEEAETVRDQGPLAAEMTFTPIQQELIFDYPHSFQYIEELITTYPLKEVKDLKDLPPGAQALLEKAETAPSWKGIYNWILLIKKCGWSSAKEIPMFEKIKEGQVWRLFTPCLLHHDFLHILFNMAWLWILGKQIEQRMRKWKMVLLILIIGIISNVAQYVMGGPFFLGFSGVVVGMAGFIWMRQKLAPWEGYPLNRSTLLFLLFFILAMLALELLTFSLQLFSVIQLTANIANTAHIVGGLSGLLLGRFAFFGRSAS